MCVDGAIWTAKEHILIESQEIKAVDWQVIEYSQAFRHEKTAFRLWIFLENFNE